MSPTSRALPTGDDGSHAPRSGEPDVWLDLNGLLLGFDAEGRFGFQLVKPDPTDEEC